MKHFKKIIIPVLVLVLTLVLFGCTNSERNASYVTVDINPSVEVISNKKGIVISVNALNDDAQVLLEGETLEGKTTADVVVEIADLAIKLGYLREGGNVCITASADSEEIEAKVNDAINKAMNKFKEQKQFAFEVVDGAKQIGRDIVEKAEELGVTAGKYRLILRAMAFDSTLTFEAAKEMSAGELNEIVKSGREELKDLYSEELKKAYQFMKSFAEQTKNAFAFGVLQFLVNTPFFNDKLEEVLAEYDVTIDQVKDILNAYTAELAEVGVELQALMEEYNQIRLELDANAELVLLLEEKATLKLELKAAVQAYKADPSDENEAAVIAARAAVEAKQEEILAKKVEIVNNLELTITVIIEDGKLVFAGLEAALLKVQEITQKYVEMFRELGIELDELMTNFRGQFKAFDIFSRFDNAISACDEKYNQFKNLHQAKINEFKEKIQEEKELRMEFHLAVQARKGSGNNDGNDSGKKGGK
ncbi:MAG TPA: hypothetical protein PLE44_01615 [Bacilli bacterium]|nr:hypothetical protein [Bacilli bacterium]HOF43277.1 hypothetical protein [Bacilli bacterium]